MNPLVNIILLSIGPILILVSYGLIQAQLQRRRTIRSRLLGLRYITYLRKLLEFVPQHRGMANAILQGDSSFKLKIASAQKMVNENIRLLNNDKPQFVEWATDHRLQHITSEWQKISEKYNQYSSAECFSKHTALVSEILYLVSEVAEESEILNKKSEYYQMALVASQDLPLVTELLGQARGIGTGVAARGKQSSDDKVKLLYRLNKLNSMIHTMANNLQKTFLMNSRLSTRSRILLTSCQNKTTEFIALLDKNIINSEKIEINAETYYSAGTEAINSSFALLDAISELMKSKVDEEQQFSLTQRNWSYLASTAIMGSYCISLYLT